MINSIHVVFKRIIVLPLLLLGASFVAYIYAHMALFAQQSQNPWGNFGSQAFDYFGGYLSYLESASKLDFGFLPGGTQSILAMVAASTGRSLGLLLIAFCFSTVVGFSLGSLAVKTHTAFPARWLTFFTTIGLATPSFFIGSLFITLTLFMFLNNNVSTKPPLPLSGYGWDNHLVLPVVALSIRPMAQIAQVTAALLSGEFSKQYIVAARSVGNTWSSIRRKHALRNVLAPILAVFSSSFRYLAAELILVELIFSWPGLGRLLAMTLIPPTTSSISGLGNRTIYFLQPELLVAILCVYVFVFFIFDTIFTAVRLSIDPRLKTETRQEKYD